MSKLSHFVRTSAGKFRGLIRKFFPVKYYDFKKPIAICAIAKNEEAYLREWIDYHLSIGFEKIYLYNNNDEDQEQLENLLEDYISQNILEIIDVRGRWAWQKKSYNNFVKEHKRDISWAAFIDIDEFITLSPQYSSIREYLAKADALGFSAVHLNWKIYGDNDLIYKTDQPVLERFKESCDNPAVQKVNWHVKTIARVCDIVRFSSPHYACYTGQWCNSDLVKVKQPLSPFTPPVYNHAFIRHYLTKTMEEFIEYKIRKGRADILISLQDHMNERMNLFYGVNQRTVEKTEAEHKFLEKYLKKDNM